MLRRALAPAAVLLLVTACSGRENDLYTYYDDPTTEAVPTVEPTRVVAAAPTTTRATPTTTTASVDLAAVLLTDADLADEGVSAAEGGPAGACPVDAAWEYPSGSTLVQAVRAGDDWETAFAGCVDPDAEGPELGDLGDDRRSWCFTEAERRGCGAVVAKDGLVTVVVVEAGSTQRAGEEVARISPLAAGALDRA
ncbi:hypothetical protein GCM10023148_21680 [Actinokineospora soli]